MFENYAMQIVEDIIDHFKTNFIQKSNFSNFRSTFAQIVSEIICSIDPLIYRNR